MRNVTVVGIQWGDEGKGKIVDFFSENANAVVRFHGGHNAGHTVVADGQTYKTSIIPSGVIRGALGAIGNGCVLSPAQLESEIDQLRSGGITVDPGNLMIDANTALVLPIHPAVDKAREEAAGKGQIGTTRKGIGPAYEDVAGRRALRTGDLLKSDSAIYDKAVAVCGHWNPVLKQQGADAFEPEDIVSELSGHQDMVSAFVRHDIAPKLDKMQRSGRKVLFEGAQGTLLDNQLGTYPFVTSSQTTAGMVAPGTGLGHSAIGHVLGIMKAYTTRVGAGPFPTRMLPDMNKKIGREGGEFGTVTGRSRDCGWLDLPALAEAVRINDIDSLAMTKLDVLTGLDKLHVCTGYKIDGATIDFWPGDAELLEKVEPVWTALPGWHDRPALAREFNGLPGNARRLVEYVEGALGVPVSVISTGADRDQTIVRRDTAPLLAL